MSDKGDDVARASFGYLTGPSDGLPFEVDPLASLHPDGWCPRCRRWTGGTTVSIVGTYTGDREVTFGLVGDSAPANDGEPVQPDANGC